MLRVRQPDPVLPAHAGAMARRLPDFTLAMAAAVLVGITVGLGAFAFVYGEGASYLSPRPEACVNCHIMWPQYDSWQASSHRHVAVCSDCHLPHATIPKYVAKADNGLLHSWAFTFQNFAEPIRIKPRNFRILQRNCVECHSDIVHELLPATVRGEAAQCIDCHPNAGHAARRGHFIETTNMTGVNDGPTRD
jgi:cytochrome c nitrite reductase small subunit